MFDYQFISELLQSLLQAVLIPLAGFGAKLLIDLARAKRAEMDNSHQDLLNGAVRIAVFAAEQVWGAGHGDEKKAYALQLAEKWLSDRKVYLDLGVIDAAIESAVYDELKRWDKFEDPDPEPEAQG